MRILVDTNVILDSLIGREPFFEQSDYVMKLCSLKKVEGYAAAHTIPNLFYILRKGRSNAECREIIFKVFTILKIVPINGEMLLTALLNVEFTDFEDCLQDECAVAVGADFIVTRNAKDFENGKTPALTPEEFIAKFARN